MTDLKNKDQAGPIMSHVQALFSSIKWFIFFTIVGTAAGYILSGPILDWVTAPYYVVMGAESKLIYLSPFEKVWVHMRVALWAGLFIVAPALFWSVFKFLSPALKDNEKSICQQISFSLWVVLWIGVFLAQKFTIPILLKALTQFKGTNETPFIGLAPYVDMATGAILATALLLQLPLIMFFLSKLGIVASQTWKSSRKSALVLNALVSAVLSPPDMISMIVLMIPIQILFEVGILGSRIAEKLTLSKTAKINPKIETNKI